MFYYLFAVPDDAEYKPKIGYSRGPYNKSGFLFKGPKGTVSKNPKSNGEKGGPRRRRTRYNVISIESMFEIAT